MKLPYEYVNREVDKLYDKPIGNNNLEDHISFIASFIEACGWTEEEFTDAKYGTNDKYRNLKAN